MFNGEKVSLRAIEPEDLELLYEWENDPKVWSVSLSPTLFSRYLLKKYIETAATSVLDTGQQRFMIVENETKRTIGTIDLFDFDAYNSRVGVGILIYDECDRKKGYATEATMLLLNYCRMLGLHQVYCNVPSDNEKSIKMFEKCGFELSARKWEWLRNGTGWLDELTYQMILS